MHSSRTSTHGCGGETLQNANHRTYIISIPTREAMYYNPKRTKPHNPRWVVD